MANRGEAKTRFQSLDALTGQEKKSTWRVIADPGQLHVIFDDPRLDKPPQQLNLTNWLTIGKLAPIFAECFAHSYLSSSRQSRYNAAKDFRNGFGAYLVVSGLKINQPSDAHPRLLFDFRNWLRTYPGVASLNPDGVEASPSKAAAVQAKSWTQLGLWKPCKKIFEAAIRHASEGTWLVEIPKKPFAGEKFLSQPKKEVDLEEYIKFLTRAAQDASNTIDFVQPHIEPIARAIDRLREGGKYDSANIDHVVAKAIIDYDGLIPERKELEANDPELFHDIELHGHTNVCRLAHPSCGDLIPFLYLVASYTGFNQQPLTHLELTQIQEPTIFGVTRMTLSPPKYRAGTIVIRPLPDLQSAVSP